VGEQHERKSTMKKVLLTLLAVVVVVAGLGAAGFAGYRYGYIQGVQSVADGDPGLILPGFAFGPNKMPMHGNGFDRNFGPERGFDRGFDMHPGGRMGFGLFGPLLFLLQLAFWAFVIWAIYTLFMRSGWRLTRTTQTVEPAPASTETDVKG
jgi:hypothetical protein